MKTIALFLVVLAVSAPAFAGVTAGVDQTFGSRNYRGTKGSVSLDLNDNMYVTPSAATYRSDDSGGVFYEFGARAGYETGPLSFGAQAMVQPRVNGYAQQSLGADVTVSLAPGGTKHGKRMAGPSSESNSTFGYGLAGVDVGAAFKHTRHSDELDFTAGNSGKARSTAIVVAQNDVTGFAAVKLLIAEVSASVTKSAYDQTLEGRGLRGSPFLPLSGLGAVAQGFPDTSFNAKASLKTLPMVRPYASYTHTTFKLGAPASTGVEFGGVLGLDMVSVKGAYEHYTQSGFPDRNYVTLGAALNF